MQAYNFRGPRQTIARYPRTIVTVADKSFRGGEMYHSTIVTAASYCWELLMSLMGLCFTVEMEHPTYGIYLARLGLYIPR